MRLIRVGLPTIQYQKWFTQLMEPLNRLHARFYRSDSGREPVRECLKRLKPEDRKVFGEDSKDVEYSWPIGMPLVRSIGQGLWEVRSNLTGGRIARVLFCTGKNCMVLLHGFIKTTHKPQGMKSNWR